MSPRILALASVVLFGAVLLPGPSAADGERWSARLLDLTASYGQESWKYDLAYEGQPSADVLVAHLENQTTSYYGALGLRATLRLEIYNVQAPEATAGPNLNVTGKIATTRGDVFALVKREGATNTFQLDFDLDGANHADASGKPIPPVEPGLKVVDVRVLERVNAPAPSTTEVGDAQMRFSYEIPAGVPLVPSLGDLAYAQPVPDSIFRLFNDVGWDRSVQTIYRPVTGDAAVQLSYTFSPAAAGQTVELYGFLAERGVPQTTPVGTAPAPVPNVPFVPGASDNQTLQGLTKNTDRLVVVNKRLLASARLDDAGEVAFTVRATDLLDVRSPRPAAGLVVLAPLLRSNFDRMACPGDCLGGSQFHIGATELVVPVSGRKVDVYGFTLSGSGTSGAGAPDPIRSAALGVNSLEVLVHDPSGYSADDPRTGDAFAVVADGRSSNPLSGSGFSPSNYRTDAGQRTTFLSARLPVAPIQQERVSRYRVLSLLYTTGDAFYGMTFADRGYDLQVQGLVATVPPGQGGVYVNITSRTTNYDALPNDPAFDVQVVYSLSVPDLKMNETRTVKLSEGNRTSAFFPIASQEVRSFVVRLDSTSGDTLPPPETATVEFRSPPPKKGVADRLPGFEVAALLAGLLVALAARRRRA